MKNQKIKITNNMTGLEKRTAEIINNYIEDGYSLKTFISDLMNHGCISGMVSELIYYDDTLVFYNNNKEDINNLLSEVTTTPLDVFFGNKWDKEDPLIIETNNQNLLAWFGFEETARGLITDY